MAERIFSFFDTQVFYLLVACFFSLLCGSFLFVAWQKARLKKTQKQKTYYGIMGKAENSFDMRDKGVVGKILQLVCTQSSSTALRSREGVFTRGLWSLNTKHLDIAISQAGFSARINREGFCRARALLCLGFLFGGALIGVVFSNELMVVGSVFGAFFGWRMPFWALKQKAAIRKNDLENHLSEMLEVVALGLRSGLSFDRSFELYHFHFSTVLAQESFSIQQQWQLGLKTREEALRSLATTYDSTLFARVVENIVRSLRFGSSLADSFDSSALEARMIHKARREEEVAKAPVKMLIPTAALILPAMLLLVLGPVLLDMIQGF